MRWYHRLEDETQNGSEQRTCYFIDGIDEHINNQSDLMELCLNISSKTRNIEFILPIPECVGILCAYPSLCFDICDYAVIY